LLPLVKKGKKSGTNQITQFEGKKEEGREKLKTEVDSGYGPSDGKMVTD